MIMRKGALYFLLVLAVMVGVILYFFRDRRIEAYIERTASDMNGGKVEIDNLHFSVLNLTFKFDRLQWTDPEDRWRNWFETGPVEFSIEVRPLVWKKLIIREMKVAGVMAGTKRATDGYWPSPPEEPGIFDDVVNSLETEVRAMPAFNLDALKQKVNLDSLVNTDQLLVVQSATALRTDIDTTAANWQQWFKTYDAGAKIANLESQVKALTSTQVTDLNSLVSTLQKAKDLQTNARALQKEVADRRKRADGDFGRLTGVVKNLDNLAKEDFEAAKRKIGLSDFDFKEIGRLLFGNPFRDRFKETMKYVALCRRYLPTAQKLMAVNKVEKPPRLKGQDIPFPRTFAYPKFLLRNLHLSAAVGSAVGQGRVAEALFVSGEAAGVTTEPAVYGRPTTVDLNLAKTGSNAYAVRGVFDHTGEIPADTLRLSAANFAIGAIDLKQTKAYLPAKLDGSRGSVNALLALRGSQLRASLELLMNNVSFEFAESAGSDRVAQAVRSIFSPVEGFRISSLVEGPTNDLRFRISSNLDEIFAQRIRGLVQENLSRAQQELRQRIDKELAARRKQAEALLAEKQALVMNEVAKYDKMLQDQLAAVEAKKQEIEKRIEAEKKKGAGQAKKALEKLLKP